MTFVPLDRQIHPLGLRKTGTRFYYGPKLVRRVENTADLERLIAWLLGKIGATTDNYAQDTEEEKAFRPALQEAALTLLRAVDLKHGT